MAANTHDIVRNRCMLTKGFARQGYDWWWHCFTAHHAETGAEKPFFIEFFLCNPALAQDEPVFGQLPENQAAGVKPSYLMVKAGCWGENARQMHRFFAWKDIEVGMGVPYYVSADDCFSNETELRGSAEVTPEDAAAHPEWMCDAGSMQWDLKMDKQIAWNVGFGASTPFREAQAFEMFWHAEGIKTAFEGYVILDGEKYLVDPQTCYGYADKNWGRNFTSPWVWLSSCNLTSNITGQQLMNSAFDIGGGRPKVGPIALDRKLLGAFIYEGTPYEFNFSKLWTLSKTKFECEETEEEIIWHVEQDTRTARMITDIRCFKRDMLLVNYESPDGKKRHNRLWNGGNGTGRILLYKKEKGQLVLVDDINAKNVGCEFGEYDQ